MPIQVSYPGVYVEEVGPASRTISGVATSITAFMGRAPLGPLGATTIFNFGDYERFFGGLSAGSPMSYAVRDFFANGGSEAIIVRLFEQVSNPQAGSPGDNYTARFYANAPELSSQPPESPQTSSGPLPRTGLPLQAATPGLWGNRLRVQVDVPSSAEIAAFLQSASHYGVQPGDPVFNLSVFYRAADGTVQTERFTGLAATGDPKNPQRIEMVLRAQSSLVRVADLGGAAGLALDSGWLSAWQQFNAANPSQSDLPGPQSPGGTPATADSLAISAATFAGDGIKALDPVPIFNLLCIPPDGPGDAGSDATAVATAGQLAPYCVRRRAMMILDPLAAWGDHAQQRRWNLIQPTDYQLAGDSARNAAAYFPRIVAEDPLNHQQLTARPPCGAIAGIFASTDVSRGVWKAPAGTTAVLSGVSDLEYHLTDQETGVLNPIGINSLRKFPMIGLVVWGARTLQGADALTDDYKYLTVRRLVLYLEESIYRGTQWAAFEPNDQKLWAALRLSCSAFLSDLQRQGAFYSYYLHCDATTMTPTDIALGLVNIQIGIAPVQPAEFIVFQIQQQTQVAPG